VNELTDPERIRVAHHEAGHALVAELLGVRVDVISIKPAEHHVGVTIHAPSEIDEVAEILGRREVQACFLVGEASRSRCSM
jgi:ATP-dependent Zn protease